MGTENLKLETLILHDGSISVVPAIALENIQTINGKNYTIVDGISYVDMGRTWKAIKPKKIVRITIDYYTMTTWRLASIANNHLDRNEVIVNIVFSKGITSYKITQEYALKLLEELNSNYIIVVEE